MFSKDFKAIFNAAKVFFLSLKNDINKETMHKPYKIMLVKISTPP